jgi:hypothetical protein
MAKIGAAEAQKAAFPPRLAVPKRPRPRSLSPELDISDEDEPEGESVLMAFSLMIVPPKGSSMPTLKQLAAISIYRTKKLYPATATRTFTSQQNVVT